MTFPVLLPQSIASTVQFRVPFLPTVIWSLVLAYVALGVVEPVQAQEDGSNKSRVNFLRDIQPILANHCWSCHGPDEKGRAAELRLDLRDAAISSHAITPGDKEQSELVSRINSTKDDVVMPPPEIKKPLNAQQKQLLEKWIEQGAEYEGHWAFAPLGDLVASIDKREMVSERIDNLVAVELEKQKIVPNPNADKATLLRRVSLDLTGLPPSVQELDDFLADSSPAAFEKVVDRLLASKTHAERMASQWLDLARYADTNGYNNDEDRTMWPWRDWVINAFDQNMPYDQFVIQQLAGDLLPNPTESQLIATGFLRNQGHNTEGGIIPEEYRVEYVADRVHTTATVFLGLSMQCARCHDHKYDPISQKEYFQFYALFNNLDEKQAGYSNFVAAQPFIRIPTSEQADRIAKLDEEVMLLKDKLREKESTAPALLQQWLLEKDDAAIQEKFGGKMLHHFPLDNPADNSATNLDAQPKDFTLDLVNKELKSESEGTLHWPEGHLGTSLGLAGDSHLRLGDIAGFESTQPFSISVWVNPQVNGGMAVLSKMDEESAYRGYDLLLENGKLVSHMIHRWPDNALKVSTKEVLEADKWNHIVLSYDGSRKSDSVRIFINGKVATLDVHNNSLKETITNKQPLRLGLRQKSLPFKGRIDELKIFEGTLNELQVQELFNDKPISRIIDWVRTPKENWTEEQRSLAIKIYLQKIDTDYQALESTMKSKEQEKQQVLDAFPAVMVMREMSPPRETFILNRGQYDQPTEKVTANVPGVLSSFTDLAPSNRLEFAQWLTHPKHPLTARVAVNRLWENFFGTGLVKTTEDFGITGEFPSHPELLDLLATSLVKNGWNIKQLQKQIVMSKTYQRASTITADQYASDPENRWLARGPRYRLPAEMIRDNALAIAGVLSPKVGGPSVKPYQPEGLWEDVTVERRGKYIPDQGEGLFRRSMYTFWKRTCPPPAMVSFDAPNREVCVARRSRTNTPLQSLVLMNDPTYVEAARLLAEKMLLNASEDTLRLEIGYLRALARKPRAEETALMFELLEKSRQEFAKNPSRVEQINRIGTLPANAGLDPAELASWTIVASTILNLDETISKR